MVILYRRTSPVVTMADTDRGATNTLAAHYRVVVGITYPAVCVPFSIAFLLLNYVLELHTTAN